MAKKKKEKKETPQRTKVLELLKDYERIIEFFHKSSEGLTTTELYEKMDAEHGFKKDIKTLKNYLDDLSNGIVPGVKLTLVQRKKHQLHDYRENSFTEMQEHMHKLHRMEVIYGEQKAYMRLALESIRELDTLSEKHHKEIEKKLGLKGMEESPYFIDNEDMESVDMSDADILHLKDAIAQDAIAQFRYTGKSSKEWYEVEPYKLIIFDGLWYLFAKDCNDKQQPFKTWRLVHIKDVDYEKTKDTKHSISDEYSEAILKNAEDAQFIVDTSEKEPKIQRNISVKLKIDPEVTHIFDHKAHMPGDVSEPIEESDGSLILTTKVNTYNDIRAEIKSWLPHIEILEPREFREELLMKVEAYRDRFRDEIERIKSNKE